MLPSFVMLNLCFAPSLFLCQCLPACVSSSLISFIHQSVSFHLTLFKLKCHSVLLFLSSPSLSYNHITSRSISESGMSLKFIFAQGALTVCPCFLLKLYIWAHLRGWSCPFAIHQEKDFETHSRP